ncbi:MAG TPA: hypothetical protein VJ810_31340 [Blastocatellia bacterium]|nr:hypothetical protein [Blastocatellia bacterium]
MLKPPPVRGPGQLVIFKKAFPNGSSNSFSFPEYERFLALSQVFSGVFVFFVSSWFEPRRKWSVV